MSVGGYDRNPDVCVLVVNWNTCDLLSACLRSLVHDTHAMTTQVIVVDNASTDGSVEMVRAQFPEVTLIANTDNRGFVAANNQAYAHADPGARFVLLLNADAALCPGSLAVLVHWMDAHTLVGACGPLLLNPDGTLQPSWSRFPSVASEVWRGHDRRWLGATRPPELTVTAIRALPSAMPVGWVSGACLCARREAIENSLNGVLLDPAFQMYSEETDLCYRLSRAGWPVYFVPQAEVVHRAGESSRQAPLRTLRLLYRSKYLFFQKHYGALRAGQLRFSVAVTSGVKWIIFGLLRILPGRHRAGIAAQCARQWAVLQTLARHADSSS